MILFNRYHNEFSKQFCIAGKISENFFISKKNKLHCMKKVPIANPAVVLREEFDRYGLLFDPDYGNITVINPTGVAVWKLMNGKRNIENISIKICEQYSDVPDNVREQIVAFVKILENRGLVGFEIDAREDYN
jgi:SynChlorMet cassette protein ScmD